MTNFFLLTIFSFMASTVAFGDANIEEAIIGKWEAGGHFCGGMYLMKRRGEVRTFEFHRDGKVDVELSYVAKPLDNYAIDITHRWEGTYSFNHKGNLIIRMLKMTTSKAENGAPWTVVREQTFKKPAVDRMDARVDGNKLNVTYFSGATAAAVANSCGVNSLRVAYSRM